MPRFCNLAIHGRITLPRNHVMTEALGTQSARPNKCTAGSVLGHLSMDSFSSMRVFIHAANARSFTEAGNQLGISSSAIGKSIARLERQLGVRLFHRNTRRVTLTEEGCLYLESCRRIFSEVTTAEHELSKTRLTPRGTLRASLPAAGTLLMPAVGEFLVAHPEIQLDLDFSDRMVNVIDDGFDVLVRTGEIKDSRLTARTVGTFSYRLVASPLYLAKAGTPAHPDELVSHACLHLRSPTTGRVERWPLTDAGQSRELSLPLTAVSGTVESLVLLAEGGSGITCAPDFVLERHLSSGSLVSILDTYVDRMGRFSALWPSSRYVSPKVRIFIDHLRRHLSKKGDPPVVAALPHPLRDREIPVTQLA